MPGFPSAGKRENSRHGFSVSAVFTYELREKVSAFRPVRFAKEKIQQYIQIATAFPVNSAISLRFSPRLWGGGETCFVLQSKMELL
jgi:hypothetical protein